MRKIIELKTSSDPALLGMIRCVVLHSAKNAGCEDSMAENIVIAVNEACMNIIQHAYKNDTRKPVVIKVFEDNNKLMYKLIDNGNPIDFSKIKKRDLAEVKPGGLGLPMIETIMDKVEFFTSPDGKENILELMKIKNGKS